MLTLPFWQAALIVLGVAVVCLFVGSNLGVIVMATWWVGRTWNGISRT